MSIQRLKQMLSDEKGQVQGGLLATILILVIGVAALFIGLFMNAKIANVAELNDDQNFNDTFDQLVDTSGDVFEVIGIVLIIVALSVGLSALIGMTGLFGGVQGRRRTA